ncbi:Tetratricopeptide-like helical [Cordyceps fumosorosea ARSEF 2679]|uniref:Tetratricopeptide-like helical n=1 Tax=Cordyceps fumosorosea (strain ARSEF 2679) TaxID=1081104 RepID=A0A162LRV7_CORFA|nr:Tetratricopeptide-like helical [Cordyceps fumosorosea ARSEF 2679]OAA43580.1 Tetratricopeptide-like helical [Cordyceps fumosorosea ARSEF 2679]
MSSRYLVERHRTDQGALLLMHRVVQKHILSRLEQEPKEFQQIFDLAVKLILAVFPKQSPVQTPQNDLWEERELVSPHVLNLCKIFEKNLAALPSAGIEFAEMLSDASSYFWERGLYTEAFQTSDSAEAICSRLGNNLSAQKANIYAIAAAIRVDHGISQRSNSWDKLNKALQMRQFHLHVVKPELITDEDITCWGNAWNDIGCGLIDLGFYDVALDFLFLAWEQKRASILCQQQYNHFPESPMNVSLALAGTGRYKESIALMSETTENTDRNFTRDCAVAQQVHISLASILVSAGRYSDAFSEVREVYERSIKLFGLSSRRTSDAAYLLATVEQKRGNMERAKSILEITLSRLNGWTIEAEARAKYRLGIILTHLREKDAAAALIETSQESLRTLWSQHGAQSINLGQLDEETAFDLLVSTTAGRSTLGKTLIRGDPGLGPLAMLCGKLLKQFRAEPDKSPARLRDLLNLESEDSWLRWSDGVF